MAVELNATTFLNMSICFFLTQNYSKAVEKATESLKYKKTIKGLYRRAKAHAMRLDYESAIEDMMEAVRMDPSDPNDLQQEIIQMRVKLRDQTKQTQQKMSGFLLKGDKE